MWYKNQHKCLYLHNIGYERYLCPFKAIFCVIELSPIFTISSKHVDKKHEMYTILLYCDIFVDYCYNQLIS